MKNGIQFAVTLAGVFLMTTTMVVAQNPTFKVKKLETEVQPTPLFEAGGGVKSKRVPSQKSWLEVEVEFEVTKAGNKEGIVANALFRYYIAIQGKDGVKMLTGDVNHVNLLEGDKLFSVVYVSPTSLGKITGDYRKFQASAVKGVAVEIIVNGIVVGGKSDGPSGKWWQSGAMTASQGKGVLSKEKTPFALLWMDRYADVKTTP